MSKKKAVEKGKNQGELIRLKQTLRKQNEIIVKSRKSDAEGGVSTPAVGSNSSRKEEDWQALTVPTLDEEMTKTPRPISRGSLV